MANFAANYSELLKGTEIRIAFTDEGLDIRVEPIEPSSRKDHLNASSKNAKSPIVIRHEVVVIDALRRRRAYENNNAYDGIY